MTRKQANEVMTILTARATYQHYAAPHVKDVPEQMRAFVIAALTAGEIRHAARMYDRVAKLSHSEIASALMQHPDILEIHALNPIWKQIGVPMPWAVQ